MSHASVIVALDGWTQSIYGPAVEDEVREAMAPYDESLTGEWFGEGSRWDWWVIGGRYAGRLIGRDIALRSELDVGILESQSLVRYAEAWDYYRGEGKPFADFFAPDALVLDRGQYAAQQLKENGILSGYAFLHNRRWHEHGRLGWFGASAATECELRGDQSGNVCLFKHPDGAQIISWNGRENWYAGYFKRFVEPLDPDTLLVVVDYHV